VLWLKALHIIAVISWMAGLLYLPRLFVYHAATDKHAPTSATFKVMERRLLLYIMRPAMIVVWLTGPLLAWQMGMWKDGWFWAKMVGVVGLTAVHEHLGRHVRAFDADENTRDTRYFRIINEVPTVLMIVIVVLVVVKPF
jgi:putative membrane protein